LSCERRRLSTLGHRARRAIGALNTSGEEGREGGPEWEGKGKGTGEKSQSSKAQPQSRPLGPADVCRRRSGPGCPSVLSRIDAVRRLRRGWGLPEDVDVGQAGIRRMSRRNQPPPRRPHWPAAVILSGMRMFFNVRRYSEEVHGISTFPGLNFRAYLRR